MIVLMAAMDEHRCIGNQGKMPWHIPDELAFFRKMTLHHHLLMGKTTWQSLSNPMDQRIVHVLTHDKTLPQTASTIIEHDVHAVIDTWTACEEVLIVCGGAAIYGSFLPYASELWLSQLPGTYAGDTFFPFYEQAQFLPIYQQTYQSFTFTRYQRQG